MHITFEHKQVVPVLFGVFVKLCGGKRIGSVSITHSSFLIDCEGQTAKHNQTEFSAKMVGVKETCLAGVLFVPYNSLTS